MSKLKREIQLGQSSPLFFNIFYFAQLHTKRTNGSGKQSTHGKGHFFVKKLFQKGQKNFGLKRERERGGEERNLKYFLNHNKQTTMFCASLVSDIIVT